jgi:DNA polymerase (family 10)
MTNKQIAQAFDELANLMELHEEDPFRVRSYANAYLALRKLDTPLTELADADIKNIKGVGNAISGKIRELLDSGQMAVLEKYRDMTPSGVRDMLEISGFGPKKVRQVWKEMGIESPGELWYACNENRLVEYKGFGLKTQEDLKKKLDYFFRSRGKLLLDAALEEAEAVCAAIAQRFPGTLASPVGELRRRCPVVSEIEILATPEADWPTVFDGSGYVAEQNGEGKWTARKEDGGTSVTLHRCAAGEWGSKLLKKTGSREFLEKFVAQNQGLDFRNLAEEAAVFERANSSFVAPELRENYPPIVPNGPLIVDADLRGALHVHTNWSDGIHSLREMCEHARSLGYAYIGITDHSQSAFYANGLKPDRVLAQMDEIDQLNAEMAPFRILKGIESDILNDGSLDYDDNLLDRFDFVIASVHSNLRMGIEKATERVLRAIEHPRTSILGHPTGRLLLSREGYPLDWDAIFEACAKHHVSIELNAHPRRLDLDWSLIPRAVSKGIRISINPDAHSREGLLHTRYGVMVARKGGLVADHCLNALPAEAWLAR